MPTFLEVKLDDNRSCLINVDEIEEIYETYDGGSKICVKNYVHCATDWYREMIKSKTPYSDIVSRLKAGGYKNII